ncbi:transcription elongation factor B polypeptide 3 [Lutzomyia longipalpis]|nr:transcription elongation factor B polypeptide 3 [Lutzomyia longipalpis]
MSSVREVVVHYQKSIEKTTDKKRLLHCIEKLYKLPVTIEHLQETGIGKTVNNLRKEEGEVKVAARALVAKWKAMVAQAELESTNADETPQQDSNQSNSDHEQDSQQGGGDKEYPTPSINKTEKSSSNDDAKEHHKSHKSSRQHHHRDESESSHHHHHRHRSDRSESKSSSHREHHQKKEEKSSSHRKEKSDRKHRDKDREERHREKSHSKVKEQQTPAVRPEATEASQQNAKTSKSPEKSGKSEKAKQGKSSEPPKTNNSEGDSDGSIDNSQGTSFADALSMISDVPQRKSAQKRRRPSEVPSTCTSTTTTKDLLENSEKKRKTGVKKIAVVKPLGPPDLLKSPEKLSPLDLEIFKEDNFELPPIAKAEITSNYRPMPLNPAVMECVYPVASSSKQKPSTATFHMTDEEAMGTSMQSKNLRTKVYSGIKTGAIWQVPTLHELCIRILQKNIDALEYTGGVPFEILKPVIERATAEQLFHFEHYNPYLMEDTDELWQKHCKRRFKSEKRQEMESWREMYMRCYDEQEARFNNLTQNIKQSLTTSIPVRKTQLAYVDSIVKPPRSVLRKQNQFGTRGKVSATPAARVAALSGISKNIAKAGDSRLRVASLNREYDPASSSSAVKPKRAPLMQKSLMLFKGRLKK